MSAPAIISSGTSAGGPPVGGSGTTNTIPRWTGPSTLGDSGLIDDSTSIYTSTRRVGVDTSTTLTNIKLQVGTAASLANYQGAPLGVVLPAGSGSWLELAENSASGTSFRISKDSSTGVVLNTNGKTIGFTAAGYTTAVASSQVVLTTTGNVGIGTASPAAPLHVYGTSITQATLTTSTSGIFRILGSATNAMFAGSFSDSPFGMYLQNNNTLYPLCLQPVGGNVGIGTTTPASALHVRNNTAGITLDSTLGGGRQYQLNPLRTGLSNSGFEIRDVTAGTGVIWFDATQQVGIGTPTPASRLDVAGTITCDDAGTGLKLPATPGNADSQTLDAYQENTWTPTLSAAATWGGTAPTITSARYTRVGRTITCSVILAATGGAAYSSTWGSTTISAPFASGEYSVVPCAREAPGGSNGIQQTSTVYLPTTASSTAAYWITWTYQV